MTLETPTRVETVWNFGAGPAMLPAPVVERAAAELADWRGTGMGVMEMSHRGKAFSTIAAETESALRRVLHVPDRYRVLFLQGGATLQFAAVPLNLLPVEGRAGYVNSGSWASKAIDEAKRYGNVDVVWDGKEASYRTLPDPASINVPDELTYLHLTSNETIDGVQWARFPDAPVLVADMSSDILSRPVDVSRFGVIYAGAQKNIGIAGLTLVLVRDDLLDHARGETPSTLSYRLQADAGSMLNTPPTFAIYIAGLVFEWIEELGGLEEMAARSTAKATLLYETIDNSALYTNPIDAAARSTMNVPFQLADQSLEERFLTEAEAAGFRELKGHRSVGGARASIYNAMPLTGVEALTGFMTEFERRHA